MTTVDTASRGRPLRPPPEAVLARPLHIRLLARGAVGLWWLTGLLGAAAAGLLVVDSVLTRPVVARLVVMGIAAFALAAGLSLLVARLTGRTLEAELEVREAAERAALVGGPVESAPVLEAVADEIVATAAEAAAREAARQSAPAASVARQSVVRDAAVGQEGVAADEELRRP